MQLTSRKVTISGMVLPLAVGQDVGLCVPGRLEQLLRVKLSLIEPVGGLWIARFAELKDRLRLRLRCQLDRRDVGMSGDTVSALMARLWRRVEIEDHTERPRRTSDR